MSLIGQLSKSLNLIFGIKTVDNVDILTYLLCTGGVFTVDVVIAVVNDEDNANNDDDSDNVYL